MNTPQVEALQAAAMPQIQEMMRLNPLSNYASWSPRQIAGGNPAYNALFNQASRMGPALSGLELIFGGGGGAPQSNSMAVPNMAGGGNPTTGGNNMIGGQTSGMPAPPPQFQAPNIQEIIQQQIAQQVGAATTSPPPELLDPFTYRTAGGNVIQGSVSADAQGQPIFVPSDPLSTWTQQAYYPL